MCFFFNDTATTEIYTLSLHDALPICGTSMPELEPRMFSFNSPHGACARCTGLGSQMEIDPDLDRKSTRLNSSHANISYAVFCLKKKQINIKYKLDIHLHDNMSLSLQR